MQIRDLIPWGRRGSEITRPDEFQAPVMAMQREINRMFDTFWNRFNQPFGALEGFGGASLPRADVVETDNAVEVSVELPGLDEKDIEVAVTEDVLTIRGEKKAEREEKRKGFYLSERSYGSFHRSIPLPPGVSTEGVKAEFKKGVLSVTLPKTAEAQSKVKKIEVKAAA